MGLLLRSVNSDDMEILFEWRNDVNVRNASFNSDVITYDSHVRWFEKTIASEDVSIYIMENEGIPIGQVRINCWYDEMVISYSIDRNYRGNKLGQEMLSKLEEMLMMESNVCNDGVYLVAYVKKDNDPSKKIFRYLNYNEEEQRKWIKYTKKIR